MKSSSLFTRISALSALFSPAITLGAQPDWQTSAQGGFLSQLRTDTDSGSAFSVNRAIIGADLTRVFDRSRSIGLSLEYGYDGYNFDAAAEDPWSDINSINLSLPIRWSLTGAWGLLAIPTIRSSSESGADFSDSLTSGFIGGVSYRFGDHLILGPGFGVIGQLEDDTSIFPILLIQWKITDQITFETGRGMGASQGPGLSLRWQATDAWEISLGARYERLRFRLADTALTPDFIGEDQGFPVYLGATYTFSKSSEISIYTGIRAGASLAIDTNTGASSTEADADPTPFAGFAWRQKF